MTTKKVETHCFPDEPIEAGKFAEMLTQDFWAVFGGDDFVGYGYVMLKHCRKHGRSKVIPYVRQDNPCPGIQNR